ncbi:MAG: hypothetical protein SGJ11_11705 [Phycisphaerae bacterium]|nr:hypothetical protein [Phycisphaerae bacterium]
MVATLTLIFAGLVFMIAALRPTWATAVVLLMFPMEQALQASSGLFRSSGSLANYLIGSLVLVSLTIAVMRGRLEWRGWLTMTLGITAALYGYAGLSILWTSSPEWLGEYIRWTSPYVVVSVVLAPLLIGSVRSLAELRIALLLVGTGIGLLIIANPNFGLVGGRLVVNVDADSRTNPLAIGALGGLLTVLAILGPAPESRRWLLLLRAGAFVTGLGVSFLSGSRGELIAGLIASAVLLPMARRIKNVGQFFGTCAVAGVFLIGFVMVRGIFVSDGNEARWTAESLSSGSFGRLENVVDLAGLYLERPLYWLIGLGSAAFHDLPTRSGDPYSHVLVADLIFELGLPGIVIGVSLAYITIRNGRTLFTAFRDDPELRALATMLCALVLFKFIVSNKAGTVWGAFDLFFGICLLGRVVALYRLEQSEAWAEEEDDIDESAYHVDSDLDSPVMEPVARLH